MTPTPNPTAEQIIEDALRDSWSDELEYTDAPEAITAALRAHGLLSEGAPVKGSAKLLQNSGPSEEQIERAARALYDTEPIRYALSIHYEKVADHMEDYYDRWSGPGEESPTFRDYADALCEAYTEGKLT